ncbi:hypothetical protein BD779DRAFT_1792006 [Infundibulicybe gibba]|nr:hypothetical protein BD779DRAFT_1792006 [Infundibulicybe gibba]
MYIWPLLLDTTNCTYHNIDVAVQQQADEASLASRLAKLNVTSLSLSNLGPTTPAAAACDPRLPDSISHSPYNITPHVAITTAAALNAERCTATQVRAPRHSEAVALPAWNLPEEGNFNPSSPLPPPGYTVHREAHGQRNCYVGHEISGLLPLLKTLPSDLWSGPLTRREVVLARGITPSDLERFRVYAHRVRVYYNSYIDAPTAIYHALSFHFHDQPIFPNLVKIIWTFEKQETFPYISMFLGPSIREIQLYVSGDSVQISLLPTLGMRCPSLVHFELSTPDCYPDVGQQMKSLLPQWSQLETLVTQYLPEESLRIAAALPHLRSFTLSHADVEYGDASSLTLGADAATNSPLRKFTFSLFGPDPPVWRDLFATLAGLRNKGKLTTIYIDDFAVSNDGYGPSTADELRLLFPLPSLTHLILRTCCGFDIDDAFMHEVAAAWPCIHTLNIEAAEILQQFAPRQLTLQGLAPLAERCPNLQDLTVHINVAHICSNHFDACSNFDSKSCVDYLDVGRSPILRKSVPWAAAYLSTIFPKLRDVHYVSDYGGLERPAYPDRWSDVESHLVAYRHASGHRQSDSYCSNCGLHA